MADEKRTEVSEDEFLKSLDALEAVIGQPEIEELEKGVDEEEAEELEKGIDEEKAEDLEKGVNEKEPEKGVNEEETEDLEKKVADDPDPDEEEEEAEEDEEGTDSEEDTEKSFADIMAEDSEEIEKAIEVSEFLSEIVNQIGEKLDGFHNRIQEMEKSFTEIRGQNGVIADTMKKSFSYFDDSIKKSFSESNDMLKSQLESWGDQPARKRKSKTFILEKSGFGPDSKESEENMSKGQILTKMTDMIQKNIEGITATDLIKFEATGDIHQQVLAAVKAHK